MNNRTITNKLVAIARAAQRGTTPRHSWTIGTFTRFPRFFRLATRRRKRLLRRLSNRRLRRTFMKPFALFLRIFACSFCVFCALFFAQLTFLFGEFFIPASIRSTHDANELVQQALASFLDTFHCTQNLTCRERGTVVNTGTPVFSWASNEFFRQFFGFPVGLKLRSPPKI